MITKRKRNAISYILTFITVSLSIILLSAVIIVDRNTEEYSSLETMKNKFNHTNSRYKSFNSDSDFSAEQKKIDILHYDLFFDLFPKEKYFDATTVIKGLINDEGIDRIELNFYDTYDISSVKLNGKENKFQNVDKLLILTITEPLQSDTFKLEIVYSGSPKKVGFSGFAFGEINDRSLVYTLCEPDYASSWFPCNDYPSDKALLDIRIRNDSSQVSVSNGNLVDIVNEAGRRTYHWQTNYPISTYLIAIYSSTYEHFSESYISLDGQDTMAIDYYVLPEDLENSKLDFKQHPDMIRFFAETFGEYPFIKEKYGVAEFLWQLGAMEHQTITGVASNMVTGKDLYLDTYVHELAHQWWGDAVGPKSWKDIWLNEGFSSYCEALFFEFRSGKSALQSTMLSKKSDNFPGKLSKPGAFLFTRTVYDKGAWVLHMLRGELGDKIFFNILREYFETYKYSNASTKDFIKICENVSNKNLSKFFNQWMNGTGMIEVEYEWEIEKSNNGYKTNLSVEQVQSSYDEYYFPLEVLLKYKNHKSERFKYDIKSFDSRIEISSSEMPIDVVLDPDSWLLMKSTRINDN